MGEGPLQKYFLGETMVMDTSLSLNEKQLTFEDSTVLVQTSSLPICTLPKIE